MLSSELKLKIQAAYSQFLTSKNLKARYGQRLMIAEIARELSTINWDENSGSTILAIEAGTGTGKTVAYCLATLPLAQEAQKSIVISTATIALQEQIIQKDLPDLLKNSGLKFTFAIAKGRRRYVCVSKLDSYLQNVSSNHLIAPLFSDLLEPSIDLTTQKLFDELLEKLNAGQWDGDRDSWPDVIEDKSWFSITLDHNQCTNRHCPYFQQCAFYKARDKLAKADIVVTNHDMVLSDLALGGGVVLPSIDQAIYIFDEGHHLPEKAINHFAYSSRLRSTGEWLDQILKQLSKLISQKKVQGLFKELLVQVIVLIKVLSKDLQQMYSLCDQVAEFSESTSPSSRNALEYSFARGIIPDNLRDLGSGLKIQFAQLNNFLSSLVDLLKKAIAGEPIAGILNHQAEQLYPLIGGMASRAEANWSLWSTFTTLDKEKKPPMARWLRRFNIVGSIDIEVNASPILAADTLRLQLWSKVKGAVITSATLTTLGNFDRYKSRAGLPVASRELLVPSPFDAQNAAVFRVPSVFADAKNSFEHTEAIIQYLPKILARVRGSLVLFSSRKQMMDVFEGLVDEWQQKVLMQNTLSKQELLIRHKQLIDDNQSSILFGLASFSEGIDLPGVYCEHVVIAKIPFMVPSDPVSSALSEWIEEQGRDPFMEIAVPDASLRLVQACGRLLRKETDTGTITLLDRRIITKRYGRMLLNSLPPFSRDISK